jgi:hypothetical protein
MVSQDEFMYLNSNIGDIDIFGFGSSDEDDMSGSFESFEKLDLEIDFDKTNNFHLSIYNDYIDFVKNYPSFYEFKIKDKLFLDIIKEFLQSDLVETEYNEIMSLLQDTQQKYVIELKKFMPKYPFFPIKWWRRDHCYLIFERMPLPPAKMEELKMPWPCFKFINLKDDGVYRPSERDIDFYVKEFYRDYAIVELEMMKNVALNGEIKNGSKTE